MKKLLILTTLAISLISSQLSAQLNPNFRFATTNLTHQFIDSVISVGTVVGLPITKTLLKDQYTKDQYGNAIGQTEYYINASSLALDTVTQYTNTFDSNNKRTESITAKWDSSEGLFKDSLKNVSEYISNDICIEKIYKWNGIDWTLSDSIKTITTYNTNEDPTEKTILSSNVDGIWIDSIKEVNSYDSFNKLSIKEFMYWDGSSWINKAKQLYSYTDDSQGTIMYQEWNETVWEDKVTTFNYMGSNYTVNTTTTFYYSSVEKAATPVIENIIEEIKTYPNPTVDGFYVNAGDTKVNVQVISVKGELLIEKVVTGTEYVRVDNIGKGAFLIRLSSNGKSVTRKLFVK